MLVHNTLPKYSYCGEIRDSFNRLPADQYADEGYRWRRYGRFKQGLDGLEYKGSEDFMQSSELNSVFGDMQRKFEPIEEDLLNYAGFAQLIDKFMQHTLCPYVDVHQVRIRVPCDREVMAAPEGRHQDGYDYIMATIVQRDNVVGGNFMVWESKDAEKEIFKQPLLNEYAIIDDRKYFHTGDDLSVQDPSRDGTWDWFVLGGYRDRA